MIKKNNDPSFLKPDYQLIIVGVPNPAFLIIAAQNPTNAEPMQVIVPYPRLTAVTKNQNINEEFWCD